MPPRRITSLCLLLAVATGLPRTVAAQAATTIHLDSTTIAASGARTLAELLAARVPGVNVTWLTGAPGLAPQVTVRGAPGGTGSGRPVLIVDGVLQGDDEHWALEAVDGHRPAHPWSLPLSEIHEVQVVLGAAGGAFVQLGSSRGAVLVTTRRPTGGEWEFQRRARVDVAASSPAVRASTTRLGNYVGGGQTNVCTLLLESAGDCTPIGPTRIAPFGGGNPFGRGLGGNVTLSGRGGLGATQLRLAAVGDIAVGALDDRMQRLDLQAAASRTLGRRVTLSTDVRAAVTDGEYAQYVATRYSGASARVGADSGLGVPSALPDDRLDYRSARLQGRIGTDLRIGRSDVARLALLIEHLGRRSSANLTDRIELSRLTTTLHAAYEAERPLGRAFVATLRAAGWFQRGDLEETAPSLTIGSDVEATTLSAAVGLRAGDHRQLSVGLRRETVRDVRDWPAADSPLAFASASWTLSDERWMPRVPLLPQWRLGLAYGEATDVQAFADATVALLMGGSLGLSAERALEREMSLETASQGRAVVLAARLFERRVRGSHMNVPEPVMVGFAQRLRPDVPLETFGGELSLRARRDLPSLGRLEAQLWVARAQSRFGRVNFPPSYLLLDQFVTTPVGSGVRYGGVPLYTYTYADTSGDGLLSPDEASITGIAGVASSTPTHTSGLTLALHSRGGWEFGGTLDGKFGFRRADSDEALRCAIRICADRYDTGTSLERQAEIAEGMAATYRADFVRLRELWVRVHIRSGGLPPMALSLVGQQLLTWTRYPGLDPEVTRFYRPGLAVGDIFQEPLRPSLQLRVDLGAP